MIILVKGGNPMLDFLIDQMVIGASEPVYDLNLTQSNKVLAFLAEHFWEINDTTIVLTVNQLSFDMELRDFWEIKKVRLFNLIVDHPVYYAFEDIPKSPAQTCHFVIDKNHIKFMHRYFPQYRTEFIAHGGAIWQKPCEKNIDFLYIGSNHQIGQAFVRECLRGKDKEFAEYGLEQFLHNPYVVVDDVVDAFEKEYHLTFTQEEKMQLIYDALWFSGRKASHMEKIRLINTLADAGYRVTIYGGGWDHNLLSDNVRICGLISASDSVGKIAESKCVLNFSPYYAEGTHDRVFNAMLNHSICLTTTSHYQERRFKDGEEIFYIDFENLSETVKRIGTVVEDEEMRRKITDAAFSKVQNDTWADRFREICEMTN
ncbi:MAG: glycosyltransferase [Lachnospiraceae bacterium]